MLSIEEDLFQEFVKAGAILEGHFILSSGIHSSKYIQCAKLFQKTSKFEEICELLVNKIKDNLNVSQLDLILSPAIGAITIGYEVARQLKLDFIFCERVNEKFILRRGFDLKFNSKILLVEDVITTGKSSLEAAKCVEELGGIVVAEAAMIRRNSEINMPFPVISLLNLNIKNYTADDLPDALQSISPERPGSRYYLKNKI